MGAVASFSTLQNCGSEGLGLVLTVATATGGVVGSFGVTALSEQARSKMGLPTALPGNPITQMESYEDIVLKDELMSTIRRKEPGNTTPLFPSRAGTSIGSSAKPRPHPETDK